MLKNAIKSLVAMSLADAQAAAETSRATMIQAQKARETAEAELEAGHGAGVDEAALTKLEAALAAAKAGELRAERSFLAAEKRLAEALAAAADKNKAAAAATRDKALKDLQKVAAEIDRLAAGMAQQAAAVNELYATLNECRREGVVAVYTPVTGETLADLATCHAMAAQAGGWTGDKPTAADTVQRVAGAVRAV